MIHILIADNSRLARVAIKLVLDTQDDFRTVDLPEESRSLSAACRREEVDVLLLDPNWPQCEKLLDNLRQRSPRTRVLLLAKSHDEPYLRTILTMRAHGHITWQSTPQELFRAVRHLVKGEPVRMLPPGFCDDEEPAFVGLSEREVAVLRSIALGFTHREVAEQMGLSVKSIETYRARICDKLGLRTRADIVRYALQMKILDSAA